MGCRVLKNLGAIVTSPFGMRKHPTTGVYKLHNGVDIVGTGYTTDYVIAHTGGVVEVSEYNSVIGNHVNIRVSPTCYMQYCHMASKPSVSVGERIEAGTVLGYMGSTGYSTGAHLHFGINENGKWIDPEPYLNADYLEEEDEVTYYRYLKDVPDSYRPTIEKLVNLGVLKGTGNGELNVDETFCRVMTVMDRLGKI